MPERDFIALADPTMAGVRAPDHSAEGGPVGDNGPANHTPSVTGEKPNDPHFSGGNGTGHESRRGHEPPTESRLTDEIFLAQPHMLGSVLVLPKLGVSMEKTGFAVELLLLCFQAMKESGRTWPLITEDDQELQQRIYVTTVRLGEDLSPSQQDRLMQQYMGNHPEQNLLACIGARTAD